MVTEVEEKYAGPRLDGEITAEFMSELLQYLKDQKRLHKKYAFKVHTQLGLVGLIPLTLHFPPDYLGSTEAV